ncbi:M56 family metallopeptidase [Fodinicola acaciae]|uniref:M56 family metallopeptidase n=1 Tax=Fodinicola acaciae TaxID=2681555 RepID=UPI0013D1AF94|nr:M56 family metallopeptidase [Fodinicola acaciae]
MIAPAIFLGMLAVVLVLPAAHWLASARWTVREPRAALVLWQALGLSSGLAAVGAVLMLGLSPLGSTVAEAASAWLAAIARGDLTAGLGPVHLLLVCLAVVLFSRLVGVLLLSLWRTARTRRRHREVVDLVGTPYERDRSATVLDHPHAAAYCLPGVRGRVVLTQGVMHLLDDAELDAVLAHEHAHLSERHDLVVLPFAAWTAALPWLPPVRAAGGAVGRLVEMVADDRACFGCERHVLAAALARLGSAARGSAPAGALGVAEAAVLDRVHRLLAPPRRTPWRRRTAYLAAAGMVALAMILPWVSLPL